jgi:hypothetical protein
VAAGMQPVPWAPTSAYVREQDFCVAYVLCPNGFRRRGTRVGFMIQSAEEKVPRLTKFAG